MYLYRAIGDRGETLDFQLSQKRTTNAAKRFLVRPLSRSPPNRPLVIPTDKNPPYDEAIASLRREGWLAATCQHRQVKYLTDVFEQSLSSGWPPSRLLGWFRFGSRTPVGDKAAVRLLDLPHHLSFSLSHSLEAVDGSRSLGLASA